MYKIFIDSVVVRIDHKSNDDKVLKFNTLINQLLSQNYIYHKQMDSIPAKYYKMHLTKNINNKPLIESISFSAETNLSHQNVYIYSTHHGIYIATHGLVQYDKEYREEKLKLLHYLYKKYSLKLIRLDIALDFNSDVENFTVFNKKNEPISYDSKSNNKSKFFIESKQERSKQQRTLKLYQKDMQKNRSFPYGIPLSRIEMSLRAAKLKTFSKEYLINKIHKELQNYIIKYKDQVMSIPLETINLLFDDFFNVVEYGKNNKSYACYYRNIEIPLKNMKLAFNCFKNNIPKKQFIRENHIGLTALKKYYKHYKNRSLYSHMRLTEKKHKNIYLLTNRRYSPII